MPLPEETVARLNSLRDALVRVSSEIQQHEALGCLPGYPTLISQSRVLEAMKALKTAFDNLSDGTAIHAPAEVALWVDQLIRKGPFDENHTYQIRPGLLTAIHSLLQIISDEELLLSRRHIPTAENWNLLLGQARASLERTEARGREASRALSALATPRWDTAARQLSYGDIICRDFRKRNAPKQIQIIEAFEAAKWKKPIPAPCHDKALRDNIRSLNLGLDPASPIVFEPSGPSRMSWKLR
ncbi:MAG: hypothetical protein ACLQIB_55565 [Isosphaeraceae bacterium]